MAITSLPSSLTDIDALVCAICGVRLTLERATAGLRAGDGHQAFACVSHLSEVEKLINGWADFIADERRKYLAQGHEAVGLFQRDDSRAWPNS
jgi:hypothetical protein